MWGKKRLEWLHMEDADRYRLPPFTVHTLTDMLASRAWTEVLLDIRLGRMGHTSYIRCHHSAIDRHILPIQRYMSH